MKKVALITGITGQDGAYLARELLSDGFEVHGIVRRSSSINTKRIDDIYQDRFSEGRSFFLHYGDMVDSLNPNRLVADIRPSQIYNLAAQSHVMVSFETAEYTANADAIGCLRLLEAIRLNGLTDTTKFYQASTSELYGKVAEVPQNEETPFHPRSPYGVAKLYAYWITKNYREAYGIFAANGILFNHESPFRGETFVTQKIAKFAAKYRSNRAGTLHLGNLDAKRDWGHAQEFVKGMRAIMDHKVADDFVLATGRTETVRRFVELAFKMIGVELEWSGSGLDEVGVDTANSHPVVKVSSKFFRPSEVDLLLGDASKAKEQLGWEAKITLEELVEEMVAQAIIQEGA